jgi:hypothetical protein
MDRFVGGEDVSDKALRQVWQNTTQPFTTFDNPIYEEFFRAVRAVNLSLPRERRLRVLLGDPPVDWSLVTTSNLTEWQSAIARRDSHPVEVIRREVVAKQRRALVVYGDVHLQRKNLTFNYENPDDHPSIIETLERDAAGTKVFTIWTNTSADLAALQASVTAWPKPSLFITRGSTLGREDFAAYYTFETDRYSVTDGALVPLPRAQWRTLAMENQFDAVLYVGPPSEITYRELSPALCADPGYLAMRVARFDLVGLRPAAAEGLRQFCANAKPK